jgi:hypothetical protein
MRFASVTQSGGIRTTDEASVLPPADYIQVEIVPGGTISCLARENTKEQADLFGNEAV